MTKQRSLKTLVLLMALVLPAACEQTLRTGKVGNTSNAPSSDGTCSTGLTVCGKGAFAQCLDLQNDREHCGTCDNACVPGIACAAGTCQQIACTGQVTLSTQPIPGIPPVGYNSSYGSAILADINGDGRPDLVAWGSKGTFQVALGESPEETALARRNRDGRRRDRNSDRFPTDKGSSDLVEVFRHSRNQESPNGLFQVSYPPHADRQRRH